MQITFANLNYKHPFTFASLQTPIYALANCKHHFLTKHTYILEPYKGLNSRIHCPNCGRPRVFACYVNSVTGERLADNVGRCNRENECNYHYPPKQYFIDNNIKPEKTEAQIQVYKQPKPISYIAHDTFIASLKNYEANNFIMFLNNLFGTEITTSLIEKYYIGTSKHWPGATIFWQMDADYKIRTGKIMLYSLTTGKRVKEPFSHITWVHKVLKTPEFELRQSLFGSHLLVDEKTKPIAITESEKTAIIASVYLPQFIWIAAGSVNNLSVNKCLSLKGRKVVLYPDLNAFAKWSVKASELSQIADVSVSDLLEKEAAETEKKQGLDLADYLLRFSVDDFLVKPFKPIVTFNKPVKSLQLPNHSHIDINELETFFLTATLPTDPVKLNSYTTITNVKLFIRSHLSVLKNYPGNKTFIPHLHRLEQLKTIITK